MKPVVVAVSSLVSSNLLRSQASQLGVYKAFVDNYKEAVETAEKCSHANIQFQKISEVSPKALPSHQTSYPSLEGPDAGLSGSTTVEKGVFDALTKYSLLSRTPQYRYTREIGAFNPILPLSHLAYLQIIGL